MKESHLRTALSTVDWKNNVEQFCDDDLLCDRFEQCNEHLAIWSKQFESADQDNPALPFIREMQTAGHSVPGLAALGMYQSAVCAMRAVFETALYYTYFRTHPAELGTLVRDQNYFVSKKEILDYHTRHTIGFSTAKDKIGLAQKLDAWYSRISATIHGQIPGTWNSRKLTFEASFDRQLCITVAKEFEECKYIIQLLFLCTVAKDLWSDFSHPAKVRVLKGISGEIKSTLGLGPI